MIALQELMSICHHQGLQNTTLSAHHLPIYRALTIDIYENVRGMSMKEIIEVEVEATIEVEVEATIEVEVGAERVSKSVFFPS
jgi:hypothetical protein